ncbi:MAG TPA: hypothetical protein VK422_18120 [Pyrinomonadaceae bacterium]|nr:hypothetical protein [Pyrinomonadaceae bacterium]
MAGSPVIEAEKIMARFIVDDNVYLDLNLTGHKVEQKSVFGAGQFSLFYQIEERRPRAHFVADTIMAVIGLAGRLDLKISEPKVSSNLNFEMPLLEISKMLRRRQTGYRLMFIEEVTGQQFLIPSGIWDKEIEDIAFVYHALVDRSFVWPRSGSFTGHIPATPKFASLFAQVVQPFPFSLPVDSLSETVLGQTVNLGPATVTIEAAGVKNLGEVQAQLEARDGHHVPVEIESMSGLVKYEFTEMPYTSRVVWEPKIQTLINLEPYLDAAITERYHALAAATLDGLTEEEKEEVTTRPEIGEAFLIGNPDGE